MNTLTFVFLALFYFQVSAKDFNFNYTDWETLSNNDDVLMQYKPNLEKVLNVLIKSPKLYQIHNFTSASTSGAPIFYYNVSLTLNQSTIEKKHRYAEFEIYNLKSSCESCLMLFNINPWVKVFNVTKLKCD